MSKAGEWYKGLSKKGKVAAVGALLLSFGAVGTLAQPGAPSPANIPVNQAPAETEINKPQVETKPVTTTKPIPFGTTTISDPTLEQGVTRVRTAGVKGVLTRTYQVTYSNGVEVSRSRPVETITKAPINEVVIKGTKAPAPSCPNGTYTNTYGEVVCRPYESSGVPAGATARCSDGTYSFSQSRRGTCSHHGGVAQWL